jgi:hypothetical protein
MELHMHLETNIPGASDPVLAALVHGLEVEFGRAAGAALAERFWQAEDVDFSWDARLQERWLGSFQSVVDEEIELDRVAILGRTGGRWFAATMIIDGDGRPHAMVARRHFARRSAAERAFANAS